MPRTTPLATLLCVLCAVFGTCSAPAAARAADLVLLHARCVDPAARSVDEASIWISGGVIGALGASDGSDLPALSQGVPRFDLAGAYVLPGLADAWVHAGVQRSPGHRDRVGARGTAQLVLAAGVVEFLDVHLDGETLLERELSQNESNAVARVRVGGPLITAHGGVASDLPGARQLADAASTAALVDSLAALPATLRPDVIAFVFDSSRRNPRLALDALQAGLDRAGASGLEAAVQVGTWRDAHEALDAGAQWLVQIPFGLVPELLRERVAGRTVYWTPTLALGLDFARLVSDPLLRDDALLAAILPQVMVQDYGQVRVSQGRLAEVDRRRRELGEALSVLQEAGVTWRAGSAAGALGTAFGWSLLRELQWMVELGLDPWEALASALPPVRLGTTSFAVGTPGDLLVLPRSPLDDPTALRSLEWVVLGGRRLDPRAIAAGVARTIEEDLPAHPLPFGDRVPMVVVLIAVFAMLLLVRRAIRRAAAKAAAADL